MNILIIWGKSHKKRLFSVLKLSLKYGNGHKKYVQNGK